MPFPTITSLSFFIVTPSVLSPGRFEKQKRRPNDAVSNSCRNRMCGRLSPGNPPLRHCTGGLPDPVGSLLELSNACASRFALRGGGFWGCLETRAGRAALGTEPARSWCMTFELDFGHASQAGRKEVNEDFAALVLGQARDRERGAIAAIADRKNTGGNGREAAQTSVNTLVNDYFATPDTWDTTVALDSILSAHNGWLASMNRRRQPAVGLTTLTALVLCGQSYTLAHVGDTRAYLVREGRLQQLTTDHVMAQHDLRHQLTRAMGLDDHVVVDYSQGELRSGDLFVLLSDGVHGSVPERELRQLLRQEIPAQALTDELVQVALRRGSSDNVTALVVRVQGALEATLQDESRRAQDLPVLPLLKVGDTVDGLTVTAIVADNGIHRLYQVRDGATQRLYALKTLLPARAHDAEERATLAHEAWVARRMQSGQAAAHLARLNDWPVGDVGFGDGAAASAFYLLYDWHSGDTLGQRLRHRQHLAVGQAVTVTVQAARVLGWLHRQGVVHS